MSDVETTVHVGVRNRAVEFGVLLAQLGGRDGVKRDLGYRGSIGLEDPVFFPFLLVLLLNRDEGISLVGLEVKGSVMGSTCMLKMLRPKLLALTPFNSLVLEMVRPSRAFGTEVSAMIEPVPCGVSRIPQTVA
jgi:hypothetical protein